MTANPLYASIKDLTKIIGLGRSSIYEMLARGDLTAVKVGQRTLVDVEKARAFLASQPAAVFTSKAA
jgi:excisionase family DNA binding protein